MTITFPLSLPTTKDPARVRWGYQTAVQKTESIFTFQNQVQKLQGQRWTAEVSLPAMTRAESEDWQAFLLSLNGAQGTFLLGDPLGATPRGVATGTPLVKGASQMGQSLITDGWTVSTNNILRAGDYIQLGTGLTARLFKVLQNVNSDGLGEATLDVFPEINALTTPADNAAIVVNSAKGLFRLSDNLVGWEMGIGQIYDGLTFACISEP